MDDYDHSEYATCHSVGIAGNCGPQCPVLVRGDCKEFDLDTNIQDVFENYEPEDAFEILSRYSMDCAVKYAVVNQIEIPLEYWRDVSDMHKWMIEYIKNTQTTPITVKDWERIERLFKSYDVPPQYRASDHTVLSMSMQGKASLGLFDPNRVDVPDLNFQIVDPYNKATKMNKKLFLL